MQNTRSAWLKKKQLENIKEEAEKWSEHLSEPLTLIAYILYNLNRITDTDNYALSVLFPKLYSIASDLPIINLDIHSCGYLIDHIFQSNLSIKKEDGANHSQREKLGAFYTPYPIAQFIADNTIFYKNAKISILDPACGTGVFLSAAAHLLHKLGLSAIEIADSLHGWDINPDSLKIAQCLIIAELGLSQNEQKLFINLNNFIEKDTILEPIEDTSPFSQRINKQDDYDFIITNPPYDRLKADNGTACYKKSVSNYISLIKKSSQYPLSSESSIDLYRLFLERILQISDSAKTRSGLIIPSTFCSDKSAYKIRSKVINDNLIEKVFFIPEKMRAFEGVSQSFIMLILSPKEKNKTFCTGLIEKNGSKLILSDLKKNSVIDIQAAFEKEKNIIHLSTCGYNLVKQLNNFPKMKEIPYIHNKRGELDLSLKRQYIGYGKKNLLRGRHIQEYSISDNLDYLDNDNFLESIKKTAKYQDVSSNRICCQQISNMGSAKRLKFALVKKEAVLGNSLNYVRIDASYEYLCGLLVILNSLLLDWRFRVSSSNNHVNNYELDQLPIPDNISAIEKIGKRYIDMNTNIQDPEIRANFERDVLELYNCSSYKDFIVLEHPMGNILLNSYEENVKKSA